MHLTSKHRGSYEELIPMKKTNSRQKWLLCSLIVLCVVVIALVVFISSKETSVISGHQLLITLENGIIQGTTLRSRDGRNYSAFLGVPYATPPIGNLRFSPPNELISWKGILNTTAVKPQCMQLYDDKETGECFPVGSEDCLYINIYTPMVLEDLGSDALFPVIVYIHGGLTSGNSSQYSCEYLMDEDVVVVMVHFRLHVFANLNTGDSVSSGNFGLKDQVLALKWVQRNIYAFGGDRSRVTLYGTSNGAIMTSIHLMSPMSKAIMNMGKFGQASIQDQDIVYWNINFRLIYCVKVAEDGNFQLSNAVTC